MHAPCHILFLGPEWHIFHAVDHNTQFIRICSHTYILHQYLYHTLSPMIIPCLTIVRDDNAGKWGIYNLFAHVYP